MAYKGKTKTEKKFHKKEPESFKPSIEIWEDSGLNKYYWQNKGRELVPLVEGINEVRIARKEAEQSDKSAVMVHVGRRLDQLEFGLDKAGEIIASGGTSLLDENEKTKKAKKDYKKAKKNLKKISPEAEKKVRQKEKELARAVKRGPVKVKKHIRKASARGPPVPVKKHSRGKPSRSKKRK